MTQTPVVQPKPGRVLNVVFCVRYSECVDLLGVIIKEGRKVDGYEVRAEHDDMSLTVEYRHETDRTRGGVVSANHQGRALSCSCPSRVKCRHMSATETLVRLGHIRTDFTA